MAIEIVDFPINSMVIFHCYVSSPEGTIQRIARINIKKLSQATDWATITITIYHVSTVHNGHININTSTWQLKNCFHNHAGNPRTEEVELVSSQPIPSE